MDKAKSFTKINQPEKSNLNQQNWCSRIISMACPVLISTRKAKKGPWVWGYFKMIQRRQDNKQHRKKRKNVWGKSRMGRVKNQRRGISGKCGI